MKRTDRGHREKSRGASRAPVVGRSRAFATMLVLWVVAIGAVMLAAVQAASFRQAAAGREAMARVRAQWAARAALENVLSSIDTSTQSPDTSDAYAITDDITQVSEGQLTGSFFRVSWTDNGQERFGAMDEHSKLNVNLLTQAELMLLPDMTEDVADSILDWIDSDDDTRPLGAEIGYYLTQPGATVPRNGYIRSIAELELISGVTPEIVRGEDWNLNGRLDPNENDGNASWPWDNADGKLDAGWSAILTASSVDGGMAESGEERLNLAIATADEVTQRINVTSTQADAIVAYGASSGAVMSDFIRRDLDQLGSTGQQGGTGGARIEPLTTDQLAALFAEAKIDAAAATSSTGTSTSTTSSTSDTTTTTTAALPGKLNINTCQAETLQYLTDIDPSTADAIIAERGARPKGFTSIVDLLEVAGMTRNRLSRISNVLDVRSNVYRVDCRGRDEQTGIECELIVTINRSTLPATITEIRTR
ncbi:MAG: type II secretion system protein GspK [Phycisphaerales bacterium]